MRVQSKANGTQRSIKLSFQRPKFFSGGEGGVNTCLITVTATNFFFFWGGAVREAEVWALKNPFTETAKPNKFLTPVFGLCNLET